MNTEPCGKPRFVSAVRQIDTLWDEMRGAISQAYKQNSDSSGFGASCLRDYAEDTGWKDDMRGLLGRETANERQHRNGRPSVPGFPMETAAKLILMSNMAEGSILAAMPFASEFLIYRKTAAEARVIGFLARAQLTEAWRESVKALDYAKLVRAS